MNVDLHNLKMTGEEVRRLQWCRANLEDEQIAEVEEEAMEIAARASMRRSPPTNCGNCWSPC
jgi:hypothetical protein